MSQQTKFIELDSNYRDRTLYPNPSSFEVNISQSGIKGNLNACDPITNAYPEIVFRQTDFGTVNLTIVIGGANNLGDSSVGSSFVVVQDEGGTAPIAIDDYYVGATLKVATVDTQYRVLGWKFLNTAGETPQFRITIDGSFAIEAGYDLSMSNPTDTSDTANLYIFIPNSFGVDNYYNDYVLWDQTVNKSVNIISYDGTTHLAKVDGTSWGYATNHNLIVRLQNPNFTGTFQALGGTFSSNTVRIQQVLSLGYVNAFLRVYNNVANDPITATIPPIVNPEANVVFKIIGFTGNDYPIIDTSPNPTIASQIFTTPANYNYEVLQFTRDNVSPFVYSGSVSSQNQPVGHEITLNSLILPNVPLDNGGLIAFYPYVYVEFENVSASGINNNNILYSNNPNTYRVLFKVPITDLNHPKKSPFVKLTGNGMVQTLTFKQNDSVRVSVKLPNGKLFTSVESDTSYGNTPNQFLQVSFCFGMKRI